jgi:hypothetical protein
MEEDISIWHKPGHFYFALTPREFQGMAWRRWSYSAEARV